MSPQVPEKLHTLTRTALDNGWSIIAQHQESSGGSPFVTLRLVHGYTDIHAGWHTAKTGTYRWGGAVVNNRLTGVTYSRVLDIIQEADQ